MVTARPLQPDQGVVHESYAACRSITRHHATTFHWAARLLPRAKRRHVYALYGFARYADDLVDTPPAPGSTTEPAAALRDLGERLAGGMHAGHTDDPLLAAVVHTAVTLSIPWSTFERFLASMEMDLATRAYETWDDLLVYMDGSAAVIGEMMLPILEPADPAGALAHARDLGLAFQLTNFLRDIAEDLDLGRQYVPQADLRRFGADLSERRITPELVATMSFEIDRCRALYRSADAGIAMLPPRSARCIRVARWMYSAILDEIEAAGYDVFARRVRVPTRRKLTIAASRLVARG